MQPRQLQHQVHSPDQQLQQDRQSHEGDQEQRRIENGLGQTLHHGHDQGDAGVLDLLLRLAGQGVPHVLVQSHQGQQVLDGEALVHVLLRHLDLLGLPGHSLVHLRLDLLPDQGRRGGQGICDDGRPHQGHDHHRQSRQGPEKAPVGTVDDRSDQNHSHNHVYYNRCCHACLPFCS